MLTSGQILINRYRIVNLLAQGGFGAVYRAWDQALNIPCALKENLDVSSQSQRQFEREAALLAGLQHKHLPRVTDHFLVPGQGQYLVMDFIEGDDLETLLRRSDGPLPEARVLEWIRQIADALAYMHAHQPPIIHRDIKPANIRITPAGQAVLVDFGIAKAYDPQAKTTHGARAVSPGYSPPEQYGQGMTDARSDMYALGATLYTLLTGREPTESIMRLQGEPLADPRALNPRLSSTVEAAILRAMDLIPARRLQSAPELLAALTSRELFAVPPKVPDSRHDTRYEQAAPAARPRTQPLIIGAGIGLAMIVSLFLLGAGVFLGVLILRPRPEPSATALAAAPSAPASSAVPEPTQPDATPAPSLAPPTRAPTAIASPSPAPPPTTAVPTAALPTPRGRIVFTCAIRGTNQVCIVNADGSGRAQLTSGSLGAKNPALAHDGRRIVFDCRVANAVFEICRIEADGSDFIQLTYQGAESIMPVFSPDDRFIAYASNIGATEIFPFHIWVMNSDGSGGYPMTSLSSNADPAWSPDGRYVSFASTRTQGLQIWAASLDGSGAWQITSDLAVQQRHSWSAGGRQVAIAMGPKGDRNIFVLNVDGSGLRQLTFGGDNDRPAFSPDGEWIAFVSQRDGKSQLYVMRADGSQVTRLTQDAAAEDTHPYWGP